MAARADRGRAQEPEAADLVRRAPAVARARAVRSRGALELEAEAAVGEARAIDDLRRSTGVLGLVAVGAPGEDLAPDDGPSRQRGRDRKNDEPLAPHQNVPRRTSEAPEPVGETPIAVCVSFFSLLSRLSPSAGFVRMRNAPMPIPAAAAMYDARFQSWSP